MTERTRLDALERASATLQREQAAAKQRERDLAEALAYGIDVIAKHLDGTIGRSDAVGALRNLHARVCHIANRAA